MREWAAFGRRYGRALPCAIHVDTGINRLGLTLADFDTLLADDFLRAGLDITLLMSHLATGDVSTFNLNGPPTLASLASGPYSDDRPEGPGIPVLVDVRNLGFLTA